jgi:hypothetical protein
MSKNGIYSCLKPVDSKRDFGVVVNNRYKLGRHSQKFGQDPVTTIHEKDTIENIENSSNKDEVMLLYGWSWNSEKTDMYLDSHSWSMSKLYHTYSNGGNFRSFWSCLSNYCEPTRALYFIGHGTEFPNLGELAYSSHNQELFEVFTDGKGGYCLISRPIRSCSQKNIEIVESQSFNRNVEDLF